MALRQGIPSCRPEPARMDALDITLLDRFHIGNRVRSGNFAVGQECGGLSDSVSDHLRERQSPPTTALWQDVLGVFSAKNSHNANRHKATSRSHSEQSNCGVTRQLCQYDFRLMSRPGSTNLYVIQYVKGSLIVSVLSAITWTFLRTNNCQAS